MQVVILAGGHGTRLAEETSSRPKPMVEIGDKPMLWHIMKIYASQGFKEFLLACGYRADMIKEYVNNFAVRNSDYFIDLTSGKREIINRNGVDWRIGVIDTGLNTMTGGRILALKKFLGDSAFMATYGDGLADVEIKRLLEFHRAHGRIATITAVRPPSRFGALRIENNAVREFIEKPQTDEGWINGGFFVFEPGIFDYLQGEQTILEREPLERLAADGELMAFRHSGFFQPMDTLREKHYLESLWASGRAPWKLWD